MDTGIRRHDGSLSIDRHCEIAPAFFGLRADILFFARAKKMYAKESTPDARAGYAGSRLWESARGRAHATSCRDGTFADVLSAQPLRALPNPALTTGEEQPSVTTRKHCWPYQPTVDAPPAFDSPSPCEVPTEGLSAGDARHGCRASGVATGCRVAACPEHGPSGGARRYASAPSGGVLSFGYFSLHEQRKVTRPQGEKGRCDFATQLNPEKIVIPANAGIHIGSISHYTQKLDSGLRRNDGFGVRQ
ncbi:hypothetical protein [Polycyclovorans algicola]|uniref:hypothetical protein n=1 Tax=Polycyclovorans algicola TaxID=616992 RepID=UPI0012679FEC|nr:hypothetical protein [Polycyclovorans algicola]